MCCSDLAAQGRSPRPSLTWVFISASVAEEKNEGLTVSRGLLVLCKPPFWNPQSVHALRYPQDQDSDL